MSIIKHALVGMLLFLIVLAVYIRSPVETSYDSFWTTHLAMSLIRSGDLNLNEYSTVDASSYRLLVNSEGIVSYFPVGTVLVSVPFYKIVDVQARRQGFDIYDYLKHHRPGEFTSDIEKSIASSLMALSVFIFFLLSLKWLKNLLVAILASLLLALATPVWSIASRALWSHTGSIFFLIISGYLIVESENSKRYKFLLLALATVAVVSSYMMRPSNLIIVIGFGLYYLIKLRKQVVSLFGVGVLTFLGILIIHQFAFGTLFPPYFATSRLSLDFLSVNSLSGVLLSPQRGLLIYCPWIILIFGVFVYRLLTKKILLPELLLATIMIAQIISVAAFPHWWGGHSFGPRLLTETAIIAVFLLLFQLKQMGKHGFNKRLFVYLIVLVLLGSVSGYIHYKGANIQNVWLWNVNPANVDSAPARLWDWGDIQFLR